MDYTRKASIQRKTLWQQIADVLREDIIRGKIKPGERIVEEDIAEKFHVSRGPVREALRHIGEEGFVVYESHKGSTVKTISYEEMQEKYLVRSTLKVLAMLRESNLCGYYTMGVESIIPFDVLRYNHEILLKGIKELPVEKTAKLIEEHYMIVPEVLHEKQCKKSE